MSSHGTICENPDGLIPCRYCGRNCAETSESMRRGQRVVSITATCEAAIDFWLEHDEDSIRTNKLTEAAAVAEWNVMMRPLPPEQGKKPKRQK